MADDDDLLRVGHEDLREAAGRLALPAPGADRGDRDHGDVRLEHRLPRAEEDEVRPERVREGRAVHHVAVVDIGVREDDLVDLVADDELREVFLRKDWDPLRVERANTLA